MQIEKEMETHDTCLQSLVKSHSLNQTTLSCKIDNGLKTITTNIQKFGEIVVESRPCEMIIVRRKDKQAQMVVADLSAPVSVDNIQLTLNQKINIKGRMIRGCSLRPEGRMVFSCWYADTINFINKEGVISSQISKHTTGATT
jgi:hypothetical protein